MCHFNNPRAAADSIRSAALSLIDSDDAGVLMQLVHDLEEIAWKREAEAEEAARATRQRPWMLAAPQSPEDDNAQRQEATAFDRINRAARYPLQWSRDISLDQELWVARYRLSEFLPLLVELASQTPVD